MNTKRSSRLRTVSLTLLASLATAGAVQAAEPDAIVIPGTRIFPESLTSTPEGAVIFGSIAAGTIFRAPPGSAAAEVWIEPGTDGMQGIFGVFADAASGTLWACSGSFGAAPGAAPPPAALYRFDLETGAPKGHFAFPTQGAFCNDIAIGPDGTAYATDTNNMEVVRLPKDGNALEFWAGRGAFGPKGGVLDGIAVLGSRVFVNALATSKLFSVPIESDGRPGNVAEVALDRPIERPDGMRSYGENSLLIVEGGSGGRLSRVTLNGDSGRVTSLKEGYPDGPVAVTVVGSTAYVLEGQLGALRQSDAEPKPFRATAVPLR